MSHFDGLPDGWDAVASSPEPGRPRQNFILTDGALAFGLVIAGLGVLLITAERLLEVPAPEHLGLVALLLGMMFVAAARFRFAKPKTANINGN